MTAMTEANVFEVPALGGTAGAPTEEEVPFLFTTETDPISSAYMTPGEQDAFTTDKGDDSNGDDDNDSSDQDDS